MQVYSPVAHAMSALDEGGDTLLGDKRCFPHADGNVLVNSSLLN